MSAPSSAPAAGEAANAALGNMPAVAEADVLAHLNQHEAAATTRSRLSAAAIGVVGLGVAAGVVWMDRNGGDLRASLDLPFIEKAQEVVVGVDDAIGPVGEVGLPLTITAIAAVKALAPHSARARFADTFSSQEPSADSGKPKGGLRRRVSVAMAGAALATFTGGIASAVSTGPSDPIENLHETLPGHSVLVSHANAMPMVQSDLSRPLAEQVREAAAARGVATHFYGESLGTYEYKGAPRTDLIVGVETPAGSPLHWTPEQGCDVIPVAIDKNAGVPQGAEIVVNGVKAKVAGKLGSKSSSMNRIGMVADLAALETCVEQDPEGNLYGVTMETDTATANNILNDAMAEMDHIVPAAIITPEQEVKNSEHFWKSNVKPITNVLSLVAGGVSLLAMTGAMASRLLRNRRELGAKLAAGVAPGALRFAETVRSAKDGVVAAVGGVAIGGPMAVAASSLESGFKVSVGFREAMIGTAVALVGSIGGGLLSLMRLKRVANPEENTRI